MGPARRLKLIKERVEARLIRDIMNCPPPIYEVQLSQQPPVCREKRRDEGPYTPFDNRSERGYDPTPDIALRW